MSFKQELHEKCRQLLAERIERAQQLIEQAQEAAELESKSSAGDKYETGRAMMLIERENAEGQLQEALKLKKVMDQIHPNRKTSIAELGSLLQTSAGYYYLSISMGKILIGDKEAFVLSPVSPLGQFLVGKKAGDSFSFNSRPLNILAVE
ncbi:MAG: 3-oxoacyl-ACP synthase [Cyclobacteriaceae bacterium]|nr:3-oxoacyl-ACP synthase [Cyclobacteriaceae bacterium]